MRACCSLRLGAFGLLAVPIFSTSAHVQLVQSQSDVIDNFRESLSQIRTINVALEHHQQVYFDLEADENE